MSNGVVEIENKIPINLFNVATVAAFTCLIQPNTRSEQGSVFASVFHIQCRANQMVWRSVSFMLEFVSSQQQIVSNDTN